MKQIPNPVIAVVSDILANNYTHSTLDSLFMRCEIPGETPGGNKVKKCMEWFTRCNDDPAIDPIKVLGCALETFMEIDKDPYHLEAQLSV